MKNNLKTIITCILVAAIFITGINTGNAITVNAASGVTDIVKGDDVTTTCEITLKPSDVKKVTVHDKSGKDIQESFNWKVTKGEGTIINVEDEFVSDDDYTCCMNIIGLKEGTATIVGQKGSATSPIGREFVEIKVTVKMPAAKMTAKQKKCKHKYVVTKKATCERPGMKVCKKCKWHKTIAQKKHVYVTETRPVTRTKYLYYVIGCNTPDCGLMAKMKVDWDGNPLPDSKYKSKKELTEAIAKMHEERRENLGYKDLDVQEYIFKGSPCDECLFSFGYVEYYEDGEEDETVNITDKFCKYCHRQKSAIETATY